MKTPIYDFLKSYTAQGVSRFHMPGHKGIGPLGIEDIDITEIKGADVLYTDVWASMGEEAEIPARVKMLTPFRIDMDMIKATENPEVIFMHCLPSFHDFETTMAASQKELGYDIREVTDEVFRSRNSKVFDEAENRMHTIKAVMVATLGD